MVTKLQKIYKVKEANTQVCI